MCSSNIININNLMKILILLMCSNNINISNNINV